MLALSDFAAAGSAQAVRTDKRFQDRQHGGGFEPGVTQFTLLSLLALLVKKYTY
jgi:hypothetical protein